MITAIGSFATPTMASTAFVRRQAGEEEAGLARVSMRERGADEHEGLFVPRIEHADGIGCLGAVRLLLVAGAGAACVPQE